MSESHPFVALARRSIESYVRDRERIDCPSPLPEEFCRRAGAFVSLHSHGKLRGCIGTIEPVQANLAREIIENAIAASTRDPRFPPMRPQELKDLEVKVDVLGEAEEVKSVDELDCKRYGLIVQSVRNPWQRGLLLPDLEGVDTVEEQVYYTRYHKAMISDPNEPVRMFRFEVSRYS